MLNKVKTKVIWNVKMTCTKVLVKLNRFLFFSNIMTITCDVSPCIFPDGIDISNFYQTYGYTLDI